MNRNYSVVLAGVLGNQSVANVVNFTMSEGDGNPVDQANALLTALDGDYLEAYAACLPVAYHLTSAKCKRTSLPGGPTVVKIFAPTDYPGSRTGEVSTTATGPVILMQGVKGLRYVTGKMFMPGVSETDIAVNVFTSGLIGVLNTFISVAEEVISLSGGAGNATQTIYDRVLKTSTDPENWKISLKPGTQRRRLVPIA